MVTTDIGKMQHIRCIYEIVSRRLWNGAFVQCLTETDLESVRNGGAFSNHVGSLRKSFPPLVITHITTLWNKLQPKKGCMRVTNTKCEVTMLSLQEEMYRTNWRAQTIALEKWWSTAVTATYTATVRNPTNEKCFSPHHGLCSELVFENIPIVFKVIHLLLQCTPFVWELGSGACAALLRVSNVPVQGITPLVNQRGAEPRVCL